MRSNVDLIVQPGPHPPDTGNSGGMDKASKQLLSCLLMAALGLCCLARALSSRGAWGLLFVAGLPSTGSVVMAQTLGCSVAGGTFLTTD